MAVVWRALAMCAAMVGVVALAVSPAYAEEISTITFEVPPCAVTFDDIRTGLGVDAIESAVVVASDRAPTAEEFWTLLAGGTVDGFSPEKTQIDPNLTQTVGDAAGVDCEHPAGTGDLARSYSVLSVLMKTKHDTVKNAIANIR